MSDKQDQLIAKYPNVFREGNPRSGFYVDDGWLPLIDNLCNLIEHHIVNNVPEEIRGEIFVSQIKEKFGSLRVYFNQETPYISGAIAMAESMSHIICESCSAPGRTRPGGYINTLCDSCEQEKRSKRKMT